MNPGEILKVICLTAGIISVCSYLFYDSFLPAAVGMIPGIAVMIKRAGKQAEETGKTELKREFLAAAAILGDYLRSGYSVENAIRRSSTELRQLFGEKSQITEEWKQMTMKMELNIPVEAVFREFSDRSDIQEICSFAEVFTMVNRSGGALGEVVNSVTELLTACFETEEQIRTMITAKRFEQQIMNIMPLAILLYIRVCSPELLTALYGNTTGILISTICLVLYAAAVAWAEKIICIRA